MKSRVLLDFMLIFAVYVVYLAVTLIVSLTATGDMAEAMSGASLGVVGVSLLCALVWYVLGEWSIRSWASLATWYSLWFLLLLVIVAVAAVMQFVGSWKLPDTGMNVTMFVGGAGFYYLATMLFSPFHAKFLIWPSKHIRNW